MKVLKLSEIDFENISDEDKNFNIKENFKNLKDKLTNEKLLFSRKLNNKFKAITNKNSKLSTICTKGKESKNLINRNKTCFLPEKSQKKMNLDSYLFSSVNKKEDENFKDFLIYCEKKVNEYTLKCRARYQRRMNNFRLIYNKLNMPLFLPNLKYMMNIPKIRFIKK